MDEAAWSSRTESLAHGRTLRFELLRDGAPLPYREVAGLWQGDASFRAFFLGLLSEAPFDAYFWETPPVTRDLFERPFEFVLVESRSLAELPADPRPFRAHLAAPSAEEGAEEGVVAFWNLGHDALLVAPCPVEDLSVYPHLAAFVRGAPEAQQHALWRVVGLEVERRIGERPLWVSTAGLGVIWLHVRLDSIPKYVTHGPYQESP